MFTEANGTFSIARRRLPQRLRPRCRRGGRHRPDREVRREQGGEEHQFAREPDDRADTDHAGTVMVSVFTRRWERGCSGHARHYVGPRYQTARPPPCMSATSCSLLWKRASPPRRTRRPDRAVHAGPAADGLDLRTGVTRRDRRCRRASTCTASTGCANAVTSGPSGRTFAFVGLGLGSAVIATQSALGTYDTVLISVHMAQHMILSMLTPLAMALGAPVTLALRTLPQRPAEMVALRVAFAVREGALLPAGRLHAVRPEPLGALFQRLVRRDAALDRRCTTCCTCTSLWSDRCSSGRCSGWIRCPAG